MREGVARAAPSAFLGLVNLNVESLSVKGNDRRSVRQTGQVYPQHTRLVASHGLGSKRCIDNPLGTCTSRAPAVVVARQLPWLWSGLRSNPNGPHFPGAGTSRARCKIRSIYFFSQTSWQGCRPKSRWVGHPDLR